MATVTTPTVLDEVTARTAGETWTINTGGSLTIKTDTRWHAKAPAGMTGSFGNITCSDGELLIDARNVRWLEVTGGSGTLAIGDTISQGAVSGYFLGFWSSLTAAPSLTLSGVGFIKFRQVTGGTFSAGALTGATATAAGADVPGWIEVVFDQNTTISVPRLGKFTTRGDWFELESTTGVVGQVVQTPTMNGGATTYVPAVWVETFPYSNEYEIYPSLYTETNGWALNYIGGPASEQDHRKKFVKSIGSGQVQIGETATQTGTYANTASQASTYVTVAHTGTYYWADDIVSVYMSAGHFLTTGDQTGLDFTTGGLTSFDGVYTVTVQDSTWFTVSIPGSGTGGSVTSRAFVAVTLDVAHANNLGFNLLCDFTSGTGVDGTYKVEAVISSTVYWIGYPHTTVLTAGAVTVYKGVTCTTSAAHGLAIGNRVQLDFTSGTAVDGIYTIETVPTTTTFTINTPANVTAGNFTSNWQIGYVPPAGCRIRIPNIIGHQCVSTTRTVNALVVGITTRPEFATTSAGYVDLESLTSDWYLNIAQSYYFRAVNTATFDKLILSECATAFELDNFAVGMHGAIDAVTLSLTSNFAGGYIGYVSAHRGNVPAASDHAVYISYCNNLIINGLECGIVQFPRNSGKPININICNDIVIDDITTYNGHVIVIATNRLTINHADICDRYIGYTNNTSGYYGVELTSSNDITISNITYGRNFTIPNCHPVNGLVTMSGCNQVKVRNCGSWQAPLPNGTWATNVCGIMRFTNTSGNNNTVKFQELYMDKLVIDHCGTVNSDKNVLIENVHAFSPMWTGTRSGIFRAIGSLNCTSKNLVGAQTITGQASVYGTHWTNFFMQTGYGMLSFCMNEPTPETAAYVITVAGTAKFNSSGGLILPNIGDQVIWETSDWIRGTTFRNGVPLMSGGTITNYALTYAIDTGSGYSEFKALTGVNLAAEVIPATGFKFKLSIATTIAQNDVITFVRMWTLNDPVANAANPYPLDTNTITFTGLPNGCDMVVLAAGTSNILYQVDSFASSSVPYTYSGAHNIDVGFIKPGYVLQYVRGLALSTTDSSLPISLTPDRNYS